MPVAVTTDPPEPVRDQPVAPSYPDRRVIITAAVCAAATLGVLFNSGFVQLRIMLAAPNGTSSAAESFYQLQGYTTVAVVVGALISLRLFPRRGWAWLLCAGTVSTLPLPLSILDADLFGGMSPDLQSVMVVAGTSMVLLGVLGAASWIWAANAPGAGVALAGAAVAMPIVGLLGLFIAWLGRSPADFRLLLIAFAGLGVLGATGAVGIATAATRWQGPIPRPGWRVTLCGAVAALLPPLVAWLDPADVANLFGETEDVVEQLRRYFLVLGLAVTVPGLLIALVAGRRILAGAVIASLIGVPLLTLGTIVVGALRGDPALTLPAAFAGIVLGWLAGLGRWRAWFGVAGLAVCGLVLLTAPDDLVTRQASTGETALATALIVLGIAAAVASIAAIATILIEPPQIPATFGSLAMTLQFGGGYLLAYLINGGFGDPSGVSPFTVVAAVLLLVAVALAGIAWWHRRQKPAVEPFPEDDPTIEIEREAVWYRLPPEDPDRPQ